MQALPWPLVLASLFLVAAVAQSADPAPTDADFAEHLLKLSAKNTKADRIEAIRWLNGKSRAKNASLAIPALEKCIRDDQEMEIRRDAIMTLTTVVRNLDKPCPLVIIEMLEDKEDEVRWQAGTCAFLFKSFAPGSVDVLLRQVASDNAEVRSTGLLLVAHAGGKEKKVLDAIDKAKKDKVYDVRHSAHCARFTATDNLEEFLVYIIRTREDDDAVLAPVPADEEARKSDQCRRNLFIIGSALRLIEWSDGRSEELATVLLKLLDDKTPVMRRGAVNLIGASVNKIEVPGNDTSKLSPFDLLPYVDPSIEGKPKKKEEPPQKSKVCLELEKRKVAEKLRKLRDDDPDGSVRDAAKSALEKLAAFK
jgi:hypothetical protein